MSLVSFLLLCSPSLLLLPPFHPPQSHHPSLIFRRKVVEGRSFPGHKYILAAGSDYFRALFFNGMRESTSSEILLHDLQASAFEHVLRFMYVFGDRLGCRRTLTG